jgi:predicted DNA-binding protein
MSATTTIRLPEELRNRIAAAAERAGKTTHGFILDTLAEKAELEEQRAGFDAEADARFAAIVKSGNTVSWSDARAWLEQRAAGKRPPRPASVKKTA